MSRLHIPPLESNSGPRTVVSPNGAPAAAFGAAPPLSTTSQRGPKQLSDTRYSSVSSSLLSLADDLRDLGVDALLEVPTLVIAGDQSSGKSSVVEAVASVALPRATGTCTRCPTEVRMRATGADSSAWSCTVKLARSGDGTGGGSGSGASAATAGQPLEEPFCTVYNKDHISLVVTAAQAVLLNPSLVDKHSNGAAAFVPAFPCAASAFPPSTPPLSAYGSSSSTLLPSGTLPPPQDAQPSPAAAVPNISNNETTAGSTIRHSAAYDSLPEPRQYERQFTMDRVVLEINGADANLTVIDLPGIIHNHTGGMHHVEAVHAMVRRQLEPQHHIIVMTLSATQDQETQVIWRWAREVDPAGERTVGVITKPDMILPEQTSMHQQIIGLVSAMPPSASIRSSRSSHNPYTTQYGHPTATHGTARSTAATLGAAANGAAATGTQATSSTPSSADCLRLGCYAVKNPPQEAIAAGITLAEARESERNYFASSPHWARAVAAAPQLASRLGADNLREGLSALLVEQIQQQLPQMRERLRERLREVGEELAAMPRPPSDDPERELSQLLRQAAERLDQELNGAGGRSKAGVQELLGLYDKFGSKVLRSTPAFLVGGKLVGALSQEDKGLEASRASSTATGSGGDGKQLHTTLAVRITNSRRELFKLDANGDLDAVPFMKDYAKAVAARGGMGIGATWRDLTVADFNNALRDPEAVRTLDEFGYTAEDLWTLGQVEELLQSHRGCELPTILPNHAVEDLIRHFKGRWGRHAAECVDDVAAAVQRRAEAVAAELFGRFPRAHSAVGCELADYIDSLVQEVHKEVYKAVDVEERDIYVMGPGMFEKMVAAFRSRLKKAYLQRDDEQAAPSGLVGSAWAEEQRRKKEMSPQKLEEALRLLKDYGDLSFASTEELFMAQCTPAEDELHMMAVCLAYFKAAHQRFKEAVPMRIRNHLLRHVVEQYGMEEAITGRLVRRAGEGEAAGAAAAGTGWGQGPEEERERVAVAAAVAAAGVRPEGQAAARGASLFEQRLAVACELLREDEAVAGRRRQLHDMRGRLRSAEQRLGRVAL